MNQAPRRCVECSQPMTDDGLLCSACQRRTGRLSGPASPALSSSARPLYAADAAPAPLYRAPASPGIDLTGGHFGPNAGMSAASGAAPPAVPATGNPAPGSAPQATPKVYSPPSATAAVPPVSADAALQRANVELAALSLQPSAGSSRRDTSWFASFVQMVGARLMVRLVIAAIIGVTAAVTGLQNHHRAASKTDADTSVQAEIGRVSASPPPGFSNRSAAPAPQFRVQGAQPNGFNLSGGAVAESQETARANRAYEDAQRVLNAFGGNAAHGDADRLLAQVDSDIQILRGAAVRVSPVTGQRFLQAAAELEARVQALQNQNQAPLMPERSVAGDNPGMGAAPPSGSPSMSSGSGPTPPADGQASVTQTPADGQAAGDGSAPSIGLPGRPGGN